MPEEQAGTGQDEIYVELNNDLPLEYVAQINLAMAQPPLVKVIPGPDNATWKDYWIKQDPVAWSLVWDDSVTRKDSLYEYYKSGTTVPYTFNYGDSINSEPKSWGLSALTEAQRANARKALAELGSVTGLSFAESQTPLSSGLVIAMCDLGGSTYGEHFIDATDSGLARFSIVLNRRWYGPDPNNKTLVTDPLSPGGAGSGYATLLHEFAHSAGLDDANTKRSGQLWQVAPQYDSTTYTVMAYTGSTNNTVYTELDKRALGLIYRKTETTTVKPVVPLLASLGISPDLPDLMVNPDSDEYYPGYDSYGNLVDTQITPSSGIMIETTPGDSGGTGGGETAGGGDSGGGDEAEAKALALSGASGAAAKAIWPSGQLSLGGAALDLGVTGSVTDMTSPFMRQWVLAAS